jgi:hypothetical protein
MAEYTQNYNLKKPVEEDFYNVKDFNDNADIIDQALKSHDEALATKETPAGAQAKANTAETNAKAYTDAHEQKAAPHSGHETPAGAQEKANAALNSAKQYTDQEVGEVAQALAAHKADNTAHGVDTKIPKSLATAANQFLVSSSAGSWVIKTVAQIKTLLGLKSAAYTESSAYATAAQGTKADNALPKTGGTMAGILTAQSNTSYTVRQVRNIILSTADADVGAMQNGDIWIKYK